MDKLIITCAVTGSFTTRDNSPYIPYTVKEIADEAIRAWEAGAAIVHLHMRKDDGTPVADPFRFRDTIALIREKTKDLIVNTTTGGGQGWGATSEDRIAVVPLCKPDLATLDVGGSISGTYDQAAGKWVRERIGGQPFSELHHYAKVMSENGVKTEVEIFDVSAIHGAEMLVEAGALKPPLQYGLVLGMHGQRLPASVKNLLFIVETLPQGSTWTCIAIGRHEFPLNAVALQLGGHVRVGFEDNVYLSKGVLAKSNAELVEKMIRIARDLGRDVANPTEARSILGLKNGRTASS
jgi:3-keto-5-aminohexanoate cleavage enzyme